MGSGAEADTRNILLHISIIRYSVSVSQSNYHHRVKKYEQQLKIILLKLIELITRIHFTEPIRLSSGFS